MSYILLLSHQPIQTFYVIRTQMRILKLLLLWTVSIICLRILWIHSYIFKLNMVSVKILNKSNIIALLLLTWSLKDIWHSTTARYIPCILRSCSYLLSWDLRSIKTSWISFLIYYFLNGLWIYWILKLISLGIVNTIV